MNPPAPEGIPTRYSLLSRLKGWEDEASWRDFFETYWRLIHATALKSGLNDAEAQDVVQETIMTVARDLDKFKLQRELGSFKGWLRNIVRWRIGDQLRARGSKNRRAESDSAESLALSDLPGETPFEDYWEQQWAQAVTAAALSHVKQKVKAEHYQIFDLLVFQEVPPPEVCQRLGVTRARLYLIKHRLSRLLKKHIQELEQARF